VPALALYLAQRYLSEGLHWTLPTMLLGFGGLLLLAVASVLALLAHLIGMVSAPYTWVWWTLLGVGAVGGALLLVMGGDDDTSAPADGKSVPPVRF